MRIPLQRIGVQGWWRRMQWRHFLFSCTQRPKNGGAGLGQTPMATDTRLRGALPVESIADIAPFRG